MTTLSEMRAKVRNFIRDTNAEEARRKVTDAELDDYLGYALADYSMHFPLSRTLTVDPPSVSVAMPTDMVPGENSIELVQVGADIWSAWKIQEGETLYFLSRKYGIPVELIEKFNPEIEYSDLQINQVVKIPKQTQISESDAFITDDYFYHYVQKDETLYSLSVYYGVSIEEIKELNPELKWGELKYDEYIKIPLRYQLTDTDTISLTVDTILIADSISIDIDTTGWYSWIHVECDEVEPDTLNRYLNIGLFLPLFLHWDEKEDTIIFDEEMELTDEEMLARIKEEEEKEEEMPPVNPRIIGYLDFYQGILLALDSIRDQGISVNLFVYDSERDVHVLEELMELDQVKELDLIIGPVFKLNLEIVAEFGRQHRIPVVSPFTSCDKLLQYNPYLIQMLPSEDVEFKYWAEYISDYYDETLIIIHNGDSLEQEKINFLKQEIFENIAFQTYLIDVNFKEVIVNDSSMIDIEHALTQEKRNIVIIPSEDEAYVTNILTSLYFKLKDYDIQIFGMFNWQRFTNIDLEYLHELEVHYYTSFYVDYSNESILHFIKKYREVYHTEPYMVSPRGYNLSMYGFDIMYYFSSALAKYGSNFIQCPGGIDYQPMLGPYLLKRPSLYSGYINYFTTLIRYDKDLDVTMLGPPRSLTSRPYIDQEDH